MTIIQAFWLLIVIAFDFNQRRIPNWLVLAGAAVALVAMALGMQPPLPSWTEALASAGLAFGTLLVFYAFGLMGAGDVKFAGALGLWVGLQALLPIWIISSLLAAVHGVALMALQRWPVSPRLTIALLAPDRNGVAEGAPPRRPRHIPYAAYLAIATLVWMAIRDQT